MARILINNSWYDELSALSMYESEFESIVRAQAATLFPEYITVPFKITVHSEEGTARADLALIDKNYMGWWVVEVEMSRHSLEGHVLPQVKILHEALYGIEVALYFLGKQPSLDEKKLMAMMKGIQPRVLVIVDLPKPTWIPRLEKYDAILAVFQVYKSVDDHFIYRIDGQYPFDFEVDRSKCYFEKLISNFLIIESPSILEIGPGEKMEIIFNEAITSWQRHEISDRIYLMPTGFNPLDIKQEYVLIKEKSGKFYINQP